MTEKELYKLILQKYSKKTADFLAKEIREHFEDNYWDNYCNAIIELMNKNYPEEEFINYAFVLPMKCGGVLFDD